MSIDYDEFLATVAFAKVVDLSATSVALCLSAIDLLRYRNLWLDNFEPISDSQWDEILDIIDLANGEVMSSLVGLILPHIMATASAFKFIPCDGGTYLKDDYPLLYDAIDPVYIVSGTEFRVPDMRDRVPVGTGNNYALDDSGGVDSVVLTTAQMPSHNHTYNYPNASLDLEAPGAPDILALSNPGVPTLTSNTGSGEAHENRMPFRAVNWAIIAG